MILPMLCDVVTTRLLCVNGYRCFLFVSFQFFFLNTLFIEKSVINDTLSKYFNTKCFLILKLLNTRFTTRLKAFKAFTESFKDSVTVLLTVFNTLFTTRVFKVFTVSVGTLLHTVFTTVTYPMYTRVVTKGM